MSVNIQVTASNLVAFAWKKVTPPKIHAKLETYFGLLTDQASKR